MHMETTNGEIRILLEVQSDRAVESDFSSHLLKDALVELIQEAQVDFWMKHEGELQPDEFWFAMLGAVANSYRVSRSIVLDDNMSDTALLLELIEGLHG